MKLRIPLIGVDVPLARPREIHRHACVHCPSVVSQPDPETRDYMAALRQEQLESVFRCGWRGNKACRGYCNLLDITASDLADAVFPDEILRARHR